MSTSKKYWKGLPELHESPEVLQRANNEFAEGLPLDEMLGNENGSENKSSRRDFLKVMGFTTAAAALASCETPVIKSIPYVVKPEEVTPGVANFYASTFYDGHDFAPVLVKTREGRPIKIEGNEASKLTHGGTSARVQASVLSLYDGARLSTPLMAGAATTWKAADAAIGKKLADVAASGKEIVILSSSILSPSTKAVIAEFTAKYPATKLYQYDAVSYSALRNANEKVWGKKVVSAYDFSKAKTVVGIACDFMGNWLSPIEFASQFSKTRKPSKEKPEMSKHYHFESNLSLTGANADERYMIKPSEAGKIVAALYNEVAKATGNGTVTNATTANPEANAAIVKAAKELAASKGASLVVCGTNDTDTQVLVSGINKMLDNYGKTIHVDIHSNLKQGDDKEFIELVANMKAGKVGAMLVYNCNPVYTAPAKLGFTEAYAKVGLKVSFAQCNDETAAVSDFVCPDHHWLESWGDANPKRGHYTLQQPAISPLFVQPRHEGTRQVQDTLLAWAGVKTDYLTYLQAYWQNHIFPMQGKYGNFFDFWAHSLHDGVLKVHVSINKPDVVAAPIPKDTSGKPVMAGMATVVAAVADSLGIKTETSESTEIIPPATEVTQLPQVDYAAHAAKATAAKAGNWEIIVYEKVGIGSGTQANNPWLQELPDPITKATWDNYITMHPQDVADGGFMEMKRQDINASYANLTVNGVSAVLPVYPQPGQAKGTIGVALGYGRKAEDMKVALEVGGENAFQFLTVTNETIQNTSADVTLAITDGVHKFASTQIHHTIMGREEFLLRETTLNQYKQNPASNNPKAMLKTHSGEVHIDEVDLWAAHDRPGHKWGMTIDLTSCIGCGACAVACTAENNVAVVGKDQVMKTRDMHWLRIDRYYSADVTKLNAHASGLMATKQMYLDMENPSHNPKVTFQPMMCQHCNHAPCETVCPVLATSHSNEGVNMMTYNRCIGTRYCANNCPFKVRRFNWFNYNDNPDYAIVNPSQQDLGRMVLNPDVVVRSRGVMEKCSMCAQRTQAGKLAAKKAGVPLPDGSIKTACQQACPTNAIVFGDVNDEQSQATAARKDERHYFLLEEVGVKPTVSYFVKVRNQETPIHLEEEVLASNEGEGKKEEESAKH